MTPHRILVAGTWIDASGDSSFESTDPATGDVVGMYPESGWSVLDRMLESGVQAYNAMTESGPEAHATFLERYAERIEDASDRLAECAARETALPTHPRLVDVEIPRTTDQLRQAADAARSRSWVRPVITTTAGIASMLRPIPGPVVVFGPNNFPFAFNGVAGGDFAAAVASGHPVIAKANPGHPETTRLLTIEAAAAADEAGLHRATVQMVYRTSHTDGARLVSDKRVAASAYTGSRTGGLALKTAADAAGKPIYLEMSSINPVIILAGAIVERRDAIADEIVGSMLLGVGQFCTSPGLIMSVSENNDEVLEALADRIRWGASGTLLGNRVAKDLEATKSIWLGAGVREVARADTVGPGCSFPNTLMATNADSFVAHSSALQTEAFGNMGLFVDCTDLEALLGCVDQLDGSLTASVFSAEDGADDAAYDIVAPRLAERAGRLLNDKAPTGVAVVPAMNHGGPFPATGHPGFTAVGIPASMARFAMLQSFDNVRAHRLPPELQPSNPLGLVRQVDGVWTASPRT